MLQTEKGLLKVKDTCKICIICHVLAMFLEAHVTKIYCITMGLDERALRLKRHI